MRSRVNFRPKRTAKREKPVVDAILKYLNSLPHCYAEKAHGSMWGNANVDITGCASGRRVELEVKKPGGIPTARQIRTLEKWNGTGAITAVVHSLDDVKEIIAEFHGYAGATVKYQEDSVIRASR